MGFGKAVFINKDLEMNFDFAKKINPALKRFDWPEALGIAEAKLSALPTSEFHQVLGITLVGQAGELAEWVNKFYEGASKETPLKAIYFELNDFSINTDQWYIDGFGYDEDGGLRARNMEWICSWRIDTWDVTRTTFILKGYEDLQRTYEKYMKKYENSDPVPKDLEAAEGWCEQIIITRFMELMRTAHLKAKEKGMPWARIPIYFTEHGYNFIVQSK